MPLTKTDTIPVNGRRLAHYRKNSSLLLDMKASKIEVEKAKAKKGSKTRVGSRVPSQYDLADAAHVSRSYISEIEKGLKQPSYLVAKALADAIGCGVDDLIS